MSSRWSILGAEKTRLWILLYGLACKKSSVCLRYPSYSSHATHWNYGRSIVARVNRTAVFDPSAELRIFRIPGVLSSAGYRERKEAQVGQTKRIWCTVIVP